MRTFVPLLAAAIVAVSLSQASAQDAAPPGPGLTVGVVGGGAAATSTAGPLLGGSVVYDITTWSAVEGQAAWLRRGTAAEAFALTGSVLVRVARIRTAAPYVLIGGGMYRAVFDGVDPRLVGINIGYRF